jgi:alkylated DNA repair dioxygenase AlkB
MKTTLNLKEVLKQLSEASTADLENLLNGVSKELEYRKLNDLLDYHPNAIDGELAKVILKDCDSLDLPASSRKPESQWLSPVDEPYMYTDSNPVHHAKDISLFPSIMRAMKSFNSRFHCKLDSCLILKYTSNSASTSLHADDEESLDQGQPICNLSLGCTRRIEFLSNSKGKRVREISMKDKSVVLMKPGTQQLMKHAVRAESTASPSGGTTRYSLSFRALSKRTIQPSVPSPDHKSPENSLSDVSPPLTLMAVYLAVLA